MNILRSVMFNNDDDDEKEEFEYSAEVFSLHTSGVCIIDCKIIFRLHTTDNNLFLKRNIRELLEFNIEVELSQNYNYSELKIFAEFRVYELKLIEKETKLSHSNLSKVLDFFVFPLLKKKGSNNTFYNSFNSKNIELWFERSGLFMCYFNLVTPLLGLENNPFPKYKHCVDKYLIPIKSPYFFYHVQEINEKKLQ